MNKRRPQILAVLFLMGLPGMVRTQPSVHADSLFAPSLHAVKRFAVVLPDGYDPARKYPVLYLLHGYSGTCWDWVDRTDLKVYLDRVPLIVILPDAANSWYVNAIGDSSRRYEDYLMSDLPRAVRKRYAVDTMRQAIAGLSMGGHGALMLAMKHPTVFRFAASFSGAFLLPHIHDETALQPVSPGLRASLDLAFGKTPGRQWTENDVFVLFKRPSRSGLPFLYLAAGIQDGYRAFLGAHRALADSLRANALAYEYHETVGGHDWKYWDREIRRMLPRLREILKF